MQRFLAHHLVNDEACHSFRIDRRRMKAPDHEVKCKASNHGDINIVVQALEVVLLLVISVLDVLKAHVEQLRTKTQKVESNNSIRILLEVKDLRQERHDESSDIDVEPDLEEGGRLDEDGIDHAFDGELLVNAAAVLLEDFVENLVQLELRDAAFVDLHVVDEALLFFSLRIQRQSCLQFAQVRRYQV